MRVRFLWSALLALAAVANAAYGAMHLKEDPEGSIGNFSASAMMLAAAVFVGSPHSGPKP